MPDRVIKQVNAIRANEKQGRAFRFLNQCKENFECTDKVPEDGLEFHGFLEDEAALYPDVPAELPGVILEDNIDNDQVVTDKPEPDLAERAAASLNNAGIDPQDRLKLIQEHHNVGHGPIGPTLVEYIQDKIIYKITFNLPDAGLAGNNVVPKNNYQQDDNKHTTHPTEDILADNEPRQHPT